MQTRQCAPAERDIGAFERVEARALFKGEAAAFAVTMIDDAGPAEPDRLPGDTASGDPAGPEAHTTVASTPDLTTTGRCGTADRLILRLA